MDKPATKPTFREIKVNWMDLKCQAVLSLKQPAHGPPGKLKFTVYDVYGSIQGEDGDEDAVLYRDRDPYPGQMFAITLNRSEAVVVVQGTLHPDGEMSLRFRAAKDGLSVAEEMRLARIGERLETIGGYCWGEPPVL